MKIALYHGFPNFHFEMLGYLIEYFKLNNIFDKLDIYANINIFSYEWWSFYNKLFNINIKWYKPTKFKQELYTHIILITDDDIYFDNLYPNINIKIICIEHQDFIKRNKIYKRLGTRFFPKRPECPWAIPSFNGININDKNKLLNDENIINVVLLGQTIPDKIDYLEKLFSNFNNINFYIIIRKLIYNYDTKKYNNIIIYENCLTSIMLDLLKKSHYILCFDFNNNNHYVNSVCAGAVHLSFTFGCKLIIPQSWNINLKFKTAITYNNDSKILLNKNFNLQEIYSERNEIIEHRNKTLNDIFI